LAVATTDVLTKEWRSFVAIGRPGTYLCGCYPQAKLVRYGVKRYEQGIEVCQEHGEPLYGYLSPQREQPGFGRVLDHIKKGQSATVAINGGGVDVRDNRDPMEAYAARQREKAMTANGHGGKHE
jgi:hypothetical protein